MKSLTADSFTLHFNEPGNALVRIHSNPYWTVAGDAPLAEAAPVTVVPKAAGLRAKRAEAN